MNKQQGNAQSIVIIVLVIALIAALGYVFYMNVSERDAPAKETKSTSKVDNDDDQSSGSRLEVVEEDDYSFAVPEGFKKSSTQQYTYTASLDAVHTYINDDGDYFEVLKPAGAGGGYSADLFWEYTVSDGKLSVSKTEECAEGSFSCTADNSSLEGIISPTDSVKTDSSYYLAFGNKSDKSSADLAYVDNFLLNFRFK